MKKPVMSLALAAVLTMGISTAMAQTNDSYDPGHPRVNEVDQRLENQQNRINQGVADGQINGKQDARDEAKLGREQKSLNADESKHGGHITKAEDRRLNHRLNKGSHKIHHQRHPKEDEKK